MKFKALIKVINPVQTGVSASTGNQYKNQEIVLEWQESTADGNYRPQRLKAKLFGNSVDALALLNPVAGQTIADFDLSFNTSSYNGKVYNEISARL